MRLVRDVAVNFLPDGFEDAASGFVFSSQVCRWRGVWEGMKRLDGIESHMGCLGFGVDASIDPMDPLHPPKLCYKESEHVLHVYLYTSVNRFLITTDWVCLWGSVQWLAPIPIPCTMLAQKLGGTKHREQIMLIAKPHLWIPMSYWMKPKLPLSSCVQAVVELPWIPISNFHPLPLD
jgi:hypothetical protein